jgi:enamine deaminase RidA (YjgF/YER057c/UK114 family)
MIWNFATQRLLFSGVIALLFAGGACTGPRQVTASEKVSYYGNPASIISGGVIVPAGKKLHFTSGITCPVADSTAGEGTPERYGDTKTQALGILKTLQATLTKNGLGMQDVIYLRVYVTPDRYRNNVVDFKGWNEAYSQYFGTRQNPTKPARSTLGVASLVSADKFIEIELVAVYP